MSFILFLPTRPHPMTVQTSAPLERQLCQEFVRMKFGRPVHSDSLASIVEQVRAYFLDATQGNWRSAGLLYYYSFLNAAKACLIARGRLTEPEAREASIQHGLRYSADSPPEFVDFGTVIEPPRRGLKVFASLYELITRTPWPFDKEVVITMRELLAWCFDIGSEAESLYSVSSKTFAVQSLVRIDGSKCRVEMLVREPMGDVLIEETKAWKLESQKAVKLSAGEKHDWLLAYRRTAQSLRDHIVLNAVYHEASGLDQNFRAATEEALDYLDGFVLATVAANEVSPYWLFCPRLVLAGTPIKWHSLLSNYVFAFALSSVLRYRPHLLDGKGAFLAEAWCNQSVTTLRYFLMAITDPPLRIERF